MSVVYAPAGYKGSRKLLRGVANGWTVALISLISSGAPANTLLAGLDLNGDGISTELLPGTTHNQFGNGLSVSDIRDLVAKFNASVDANTKRITNEDGSVTTVLPRTPFNQVINPIVLPDKFAPDDSLLAQDLRISRDIPIREKLRVSVIGEVFNLFNFANLAGFPNVINQSGYGQPTSRVGQAFGSGGPRSFQFAARLTF